MEILTSLWISALVAVSIALLYKLLTRNHDYWEKHGIPYAPPWPFVGSLGPLITGALHTSDLKRYKKYGSVYGHFEGNRPVINVADTELLKNILVKDFQFFANRRDITTGNPIADNMVSNIKDEHWKRVRSIITPAFTTGKIKKMTEIILDSAKILGLQLKEAADSGKPIEAKRSFGTFTMDVIASSAFGTKIDSYHDPNNVFVATARKVFRQRFSWRLILFFLFPKLLKLFGISVFEPTSMEFFKEATLKILEERNRTKKTRNDFLQLLMEAAKESDTTDKGNIAPLNQDELIAQCVIFFIAGYDTTASTLSFASYELTMNPNLQEHLISEIDSVVRANEGKITYEGVQSMKYLDQVISETLRKYPPAVRLERLTEEDYKLGYKDFTIPKGMIVGIPSFAIHHAPEFYPDPEKFDPERFSAEEKSHRNPYVYLPFGAGPRNCLGMRFALMEIKICLAHVLSQFRFKRIPETQSSLKIFSGQGLMQPLGITLGVEERKDKVLRA